MNLWLRGKSTSTRNRPSRSLVKKSHEKDGQGGGSSIPLPPSPPPPSSPPYPLPLHSPLLTFFSIPEGFVLLKLGANEARSEGLKSLVRQGGEEIVNGGDTVLDALLELHGTISLRLDDHTEA